MAENINPLTGLPFGDDPNSSTNINPLTGKRYTTAPVTSARSTLSGARTMTGAFEDYQGTYFSPETQVSPFTNIDEQRARNQSNWDKWGNGLAKAGLTFVGSVSENTVGYALGLADYALSGFEDFEESMKNNPVGRAFDKANEYAREHLPNYQTAEERSEQGTLAQLGNANFWADTFMNGAAYSLGSIATMYLTGGIGAVSGVTRALGTGAKISKGLAGYRAAKAIQNGMAPIEALRKGAELRAGLSAGSKALGFLEGGAMMSIAESAVEARETERTVRDELVADYMMRYDVSDPNMIPDAEMDDIENSARLLSNQVFDANMAVLMPTNLLQFHGLLRPMQMGNNAIHGTRFMNEGGKKVLRDNLDALPGWASRGAKVARTYAKPTIGSAATEGFQEGTQYALSQGAVEVAKEGAEDKANGAVSIYEALTGGRNNKASMLNIARKGAPNVNSAEGREQVMVGALVGLLTGGVGGVRSAVAKDQRTKEALEHFSKLDANMNLKTAAQANAQAQVYLQRMEEAEATGDTQAYEDAQFSLLRTLAFDHAQRGTFDAFIERLQDAKNLPVEEFESLFGVDTLSNEAKRKNFRNEKGQFVSREQQQRERIDSLIDRATEAKEMYEQIEEMYPSQSPKGLIKKGMIRLAGGKQRLEELQKQDEDAAIYKRAMAFAGTSSKHASARIEKYAQQLRELDPELNVEELLDMSRKELAKVVMPDPTKSDEKILLEDESELREALLDSFARAVENDPTKAQKAASLIGSLSTLLEERNTATLAFKNLEESPEQRDLYVSRQRAEEQRQEQLQKDKTADSAIEETTRVDELQKKMDSMPDDISPAANKRLQEEKAKRVAERNKHLNKYRRMEPSEVQKIDPSTVEDPLQREALELDLQDIKSGKRTKAIGKKPSRKGKTKTTRDSNRRDRKKAAENTQEPSEQKGSSLDQRGAARKSVERDEQDKREVRTKARDNTTGEKSGEYKLNPGPNSNDQVVVDKNGQPIQGEFDKSHTLNGEPIINGRSVLLDPEVGAGTKAKVVIIQNDRWQSLPEESDEKKDPVRNIPMYLEVNGKIVGVVPAGNNSLRQAVFANQTTGADVEVTLEEKYANNFTNAVMSGPLGSVTGTRYYYNPVEELNNPIFGVITAGPDGTSKYTVPQGDLTNEEYAKVQESLLERPQGNVTPGQVFALTEDPVTGKYRPVMMQTAYLTEDAIVEVKAAMEGSSNEDLNTIEALVGGNTLYGVEGYTQSGSPRFFRSRRSGDVILHTFQASTPGRGVLNSKISPDGKVMVRVSNKTLARISNGEKLTLEDLTDVERNGLLVKPKISVTESGVQVTDEIPIGDEMPEVQQYVLDRLPKLVTSALQAKRFQVSIDSLNTKGDFKIMGQLFKAQDGVGGYSRYITAPGQKLINHQGHNSIVSSNVFSNNGSPFTDIGVRYSADFVVGGQKVEPEQEVVPQTQPPQSGDPTPTDPSNEFDSMDFGQNDDSGFDPDSLPDPTSSSEFEGPTLEDELDGAVPFGFDEPGDGTPPFRLRPESKQRLNEEEAKAWLQARGIPVEMYSHVMRIGNGVAHGYMEAAGVHLWTQGEVGTEYHEGFHYVFRTMLTDKQRDALYKEAAKRYGLTKEELDTLRKLNPDLAMQQLRELGLEERMAEDFRDYVMSMQETSKTLPGKIRKFFSDLYNFIKALFIDPVSIRQLYSLIESNNIPKKFLRKADTFKAKATAFAYVDAVTDRDVHKEIALTLSTRFMEAYNQKRSELGRELSKEEFTKILGTLDNKGVLADAFLRDSARYRDTGKKLNTEDFVKLKRALDAGENWGAVLNEIGAIPMPPVDTGLPDTLLKGMNNRRQYNVANLFKNIYVNWENKVSTDGLDNIEQFGFRDVMIQDLERFGFNIRYKQVNNRKAQENKLREDEFDEVAQFDKIYELSAIEQNPLDSLTGETKRQLSTIKSDKPNFMGLTTYIDVAEVVRLIVPAAADNTRLDDIVRAIEEKSANFPQLRPVVEALNNDFTPQQRALFKRTFANSYNRLRILEESFDDNNSKSSRIIDSNRKSAARAAVDEWKQGGTQKVIEKKNAPLIREEDGTLVPNDSFGLAIEDDLQGQSRTELLEGAYRNLRDRTLAYEDRVRALSDTLYYLGLNLGRDRAESRLRWKSYLETFPNERVAFAELIEGTDRLRIDRMVSSLIELDFDSKGNIMPAKGKIRERAADFFTSESSSVNALSQIKGRFEVPLALSIVNGEGKAVYPYNQQTPMSDIIDQLGREEVGEDVDNILKLMEKDEFFNAFGVGEFQSIIMRLGESNKYEFQAFSLDVFKVDEDDVNSTGYKDLSARESLLVRLDAYANNGNASEAVYVIPTQEARGRMDMLTMPRFGSNKSMKAAGLQDMGGHKEALRGLIVQDLIRINRDEKIIAEGEGLIDGYHTGRNPRYKVFQLSGVENKKVKGSKLSEYIDFDVLENPDSPEGQAFFEEVDKMVDQYMKKVVPAMVNELKDRIDKYNLNVEGKSRLSLTNINKLGGLDTFLTNYVIDDVIARLEMAKVFRGGIQTAKNTTDFYKRMGLVNTPGNIFMMRGEDLNDPNYGMLTEFNQVAIADVTIQDAFHGEIKDRYQQILEESGLSKDQAKAIADAYDVGVADATDAQAFISPEFWRAIKQGEGTWTDEMDQKWKKWKDTGKWTFGFVEPLKMYHEEQRAVPFTVDGETIYKYAVDMDKNSYHVLTPDFVGKTPANGVPTLMQQMYKEMVDKNIHMFNTVSAKKGIKQNIFEIDPTKEKGLFEGAVITKQRGKNLRKPQTINNKEYDLVRLSRQLRKNGINLVQRGETYVLNAGIAGLEREVTGQEMLDMYHNSFETMLRMQMDELKRELGYDTLIQAQQSGDVKAIKEARERIYKELRDMFQRENIKRDRLDDNTERQLQLVYEDGVVDFAIPLGMPAYQDKYQNLFFGLFKNRVLKTMMSGKEVVQVASPGTFDVFNYETGEYENRELRYLDVKIDPQSGSRIVHAEVLISAPIAKRLGLKPGDDLSQVPEELLRSVGYRIPHQGKSSTLLMKVAGILPKSYNKSIVVPGNITVMMGSDFDVDKMFVMFPEFAKKSPMAGDVAKVTLDNYQSLRGDAQVKGSKSDLLMAAHKNTMLDVLEAVASSALHAEETLTPLATDALDSIIETLPEKEVDSLPFDHPLKEIQMEENYKFAQKLVGVYANMLAGLSVAANGNQGRGVAVHESRAVQIDGETYNTLKGSKESFGILIEHLSGALDAGKKVIQPALNDNLETFAAKTYLYSLGIDPLLVTKMHRAPIIMDFVELVNVQGLNPTAAFDQLGVNKSLLKEIKALSLEDAAVFKPTTTAEIDEVLTMEANEAGLYPEAAVEALRNFAVTYYAGKDMQKLFTAITTDVADGIGDLATLQVILETIESFDREKGMFSAADVAQFLQGDSFGISRAFFETFSEMMALTSDFFLGATPALKQAKNNLLGLTGRTDALTQEEHRLVDRQLFYMMMTKEGSPLSRFVTPETARMMTNPEFNMVTSLEDIRRKYPEVRRNPFVMRLKESPSNESDMNRVYNIQFENMQKMTTDLKNELIAAFEDLLFNENPEIRKFGEKLVMNQLLTQGFTPGYGAYYDLIPARFFTTKVRAEDTQTPAQWAKSQIREIQQNPSYFNEGDLIELLQSIGPRRTKGRLFIPLTRDKSASSQVVRTDKGELGTVITFSKDGPVMMLRKAPGKKSVDRYQLLLRRGAGQYVVLNQKSLTGQLNELNTGGPSALASAPNATTRREGWMPDRILHQEGGTRGMIADVMAGNAKDTNLRTISSDQSDKRVVTKRCN